MFPAVIPATGHLRSRAFVVRERCDVETLVESEPKVLYAALPILWVTGVTKATAKSRSGDYGPYGGYECPCYKYPNRGDRYLVFYVTLPSRDHRPRHRALRGAALLCSKE